LSFIYQEVAQNDHKQNSQYDFGMKKFETLVEFSRNMLLLNFFELISSQNNPKNSVKIRLFIGRFKKSCF